MPEKSSTYAPEKTIAHEPERSRYALRLDGKVVGVADYARDGDALAITHTGVEPRLRGQGLAGELVEFVLDDIRDSDLQVLPYCSYVSDYIARRPEYLELVPAERRRAFGLRPGD
ncbi:MAG TPA: GNAT family N-acetyltransferase [Solirubrobacterales bacterium]|jgi:predicted GNAT family acetyltransferase|nr:GNAT family N-acetyltransferase [Solirubrobacterales bacterium]